MQWKSNNLLCSTNTAHLIYSKCHNYVRLLVNDFSFAPWITQICLHLQKQRECDKSIQGHRMIHINCITGSIYIKWSLENLYPEEAA